MKERIHLVIGNRGQVGSALFSKIEKNGLPVMGIDYVEGEKKTIISPADINDFEVTAMHICIRLAGTDKLHDFCRIVCDYVREFNPHVTIIHSTIPPGTTSKINTLLESKHLLAYSPVRGQHNRLERDLDRYDKWSAGIDEESSVAAHHALCQEIGFNWKGADKPETLELVKLLDTTQFGVLISWAQAAKGLCDMFNVNFDYVHWFGKQTDEFYGVRPDISPGFIGGHCVRQNMNLILDMLQENNPTWKFLDNIMQRNVDFRDKLEKEGKTVKQ